MGDAILFVYGTLKRGERNHHRIAVGTFVGETTTAATYRVHDLGPYPGMVLDENNGLAVVGELWQVGEKILAAIDEYEGVPDLFDRRPVALADGGTADAYFWVGPVPAGRASGDRFPVVSPRPG